MTEELKVKKSSNFLIILLILAAAGFAYVKFSHSVLTMPSAPASALTAEEYHQADTYCKANGLDVEVSTDNKWVFAVACKRIDGLLLAIPKAKTAEKLPQEKMEATPEIPASVATPAPALPMPAVSGITESKPLS
ncbi:MAG: hypothetical protein PHP70_04860 [Gallionella sp.]|nr:hypothetical protein [Gallionella sp.]